jgi:hypothetical protein
VTPAEHRDGVPALATSVRRPIVTCRWSAGVLITDSAYLGDGILFARTGRVNVTPNVSIPFTANDQMDGFAARLRLRVTRSVNHCHRVVCGMHGHSLMQRSEGGRIFLECLSCGHQTEGWRVR